MVKSRLGWLICGLLALAGLALGYRGLTSTASTVKVEWTTATELNTAGFNLYRSENRDGPFDRVNPQLIPHAPDPLVGGSYIYTDTTVVAERTYYYQLEDVDFNASSTRHGPIEVKAERGGTLELFAAVFCLILAALGVVQVLTPHGAADTSRSAGSPNNKNV
jgi:hypothetical protein